MMKRKTVFLDRDGTINVEKNYLYRPEDFLFIEKAPEAIARLNRLGFQVIVVSNQAGVARGYYTEEDVRRLHSYIQGELKKQGAHIDAFYYCPHHPEAGIGKYRISCRCRKPDVGMFEQACRDFAINVEKSWMIGDNKGDILAGRSFGLQTIMVRTGYGRELEQSGFLESDYISDDLYCAADLIVGAEMNGRREINGRRDYEESR